LLHNASRKFICDNYYLKTISTNSLITSEIDASSILKIPIAHGEGLYFANDKIIDELNTNDQILFKYCSKEGEINMESNPNGSLHNIAGVCNKNRNVFGMMPHPERASDSLLGNTDGAGIFASILAQAEVM